MLAAAFPSMPLSAEPAAASTGPALLAADLPPAVNPQPATAPQRPRALPPAAGSLLMPPQPPAVRSEQLEKTARQADRQVRRGFELANRGACYAARAEFVAALRLLAQALDAEHRTTNHSRSLSAALTALKEAQDFLPTGGKLESDLDLPTLIASHRTPILKGAAAENLVPLVALKSYFTFAQEQLGSGGRPRSGRLDGPVRPGQAARGGRRAEDRRPARRRVEGGRVLSGRAVGLPAKPHGRQRPGRLARPRGLLPRSPLGAGTERLASRGSRPA